MFNKNTEYAVTILRELKRVKDDGQKVCSLEAVAKLTNIKLGFAEQISRKLRVAKVITSTRGPGGGYSITEAGEKINLWELMLVVEPALSTKVSKLLPTSKELYYECAEKIKAVYIFN